MIRLFSSRNRVARRVFLQILLWVMTPIAGLSLVSVSLVTRQLEIQSMERLRSVTKDASMRAIEHLRLATLDTQIFLEDLASAGLPLTKDVARAHVRMESAFEAVTLHLPHGPVSCWGDPQTLPVIGPTERAHLAEGKSLLAIERTNEGGYRFLILRDMGSFGLGNGVLVGRLHAEALFAEEGEGRALAVVDGDRVVFTRDAAVFGKRLPVTAGDQGRATGFRLSDTPAGEQLGFARTIFLRPLYGRNITVAYSEPVSLVHAPIRSFGTLFLLGNLLAILVAVLVSLRRIRASLEPLSRLRETTLRIAAGDLEARAEESTDDELGDLARSFNLMARRIQKRTEELLAANEAKNRFLANVTHELRTPMTSILGYADLCAETTEGEHLEYLEVIQRSGRHLLRIVSDILDLAQMEARPLPMLRSACSPAAVLAEVTRMVDVQRRAKGLELSTVVAPGVPEQIETDPDRLRQVLLNLISNAVKFTESGGIEVRVELVQRGKPCLRFEIQDTGPGIPLGVRGRLFRPFEQADDSLTRTHGGTGLGLALSRAIARMLGGDLVLGESDERGSTFVLTIDPGESLAFPAPLPSSPEVGASPITALLQAPRALLVEDVVVNRRLARRFLEKNGLEVDEAENGRVAVDKALLARDEGRPYDLIFMDIQMPVLDGYEATRTLRRLGYTGTIVALTAHSANGERERCLAAGCDEFLNKPIDREKLRRVIRERLPVPAESESAQAG